MMSTREVGSGSSAYVSLYQRRLPQFTSLRSNGSSLFTQRTPVAAEISNYGPQEGNQGNKPAPPPGYGVAHPTVDFLGILTVVNTITDYITLVLLIQERERVATTMFIFGLGAALILRVGAVYQYFEQITYLSRFSNIFFGSRFGWKEKFDFQVMSQANIGVQFGFPLVMHSVADIVQHGFTFYPLFILVTAGEANSPDSIVFFVISVVVTGVSMLGSLLVRLSYGAALISLSLLVVFATLMLAFVMSNLIFGIDFEDKVYTSGLFFPWVRFIALVVSGFTTTAVEVRQKKRIILPSFLSSLVAILLIIDILAIMLINFRPSLFIDEDGGEKITDENIIVDQIIYVNAVYDAYVALYMFVQWRLLLFGGMA